MQASVRIETHDRHAEQLSLYPRNIRMMSNFSSSHLSNLTACQARGTSVRVHFKVRSLNPKRYTKTYIATPVELVTNFFHMSITIQLQTTTTTTEHP